MFRPNDRHLHPFLISNVNDLPEKHRIRMETSWAGVFFRETFSRSEERPFSVLYADIPSRPNIPVNVLVGLESLKADFGWSDEELYAAFTYDMQVRYALGYHQLGEGDFDLHSLYYFREKVSRYMQEKGINLIEKAFEQVTGQQIKAYQLKTDTGEHLQKIGDLMQRLLVELQPNYGQESVYQMLERVFGEHFRVEEKIVKTKGSKELSASSLQSPDDLEATYREKGNKSYKGYAANLTETCDSVNDLQLLTKAQVTSNFVAHFDLAICQACPFYQKVCPVQPGKRDLRLHLNFREQQANMSQRRRRSLARQKERRNLRAAIEATIREIKHPFPASKLPVRGRYRVACMVIGSAIATNASRIQRYLVAKTKLENDQKKVPKGQECSQDPHSVSFFGSLKAIWKGRIVPLSVQKLCLGW